MQKKGTMKGALSERQRLGEYAAEVIAVGKGLEEEHADGLARLLARDENDDDRKQQGDEQHDGELGGLAEHALCLVAAEIAAEALHKILFCHASISSIVSMPSM